MTRAWITPNARKRHHKLREKNRAEFVRRATSAYVEASKRAAIMGSRHNLRDEIARAFSGRA